MTFYREKNIILITSKEYHDWISPNVFLKKNFFPISRRNSLSLKADFTKTWHYLPTVQCLPYIILQLLFGYVLSTFINHRFDPKQYFLEKKKCQRWSQYISQAKTLLMLAFRYKLMKISTDQQNNTCLSELYRSF